MEGLKQIHFSKIVQLLDHKRFWEYGDNGRIYSQEDWCRSCGEYLMWAKTTCSNCHNIDDWESKEI